MWHQPLLVDTVSMESSAQVIVDPPTNHAPKRVCHHLERLGVACVVPDAQQQRKTVSIRELGSRAEAAIHAVVIGCQLARRFGQQAAVECPPRHKRVGILLEEICQSLGLGFNLAALGGVVIGNRLQNPTKSRPAVTIVRREIGAAIEGPQVRGEEHGHRPPPTSRHRLNGCHIDLVEVGPLLAVNLDIDVVLIHPSGDACVLKRLTFHRVTPVAGRVADRQQNRSILIPRRGQRLLPPGKPVDGVGRVLQQIRRGLTGETIPGFCAGVMWIRGHAMPETSARGGTKEPTNASLSNVTNPLPISQPRFPISNCSNS